MTMTNRGEEILNEFTRMKLEENENRKQTMADLLQNYVYCTISKEENGLKRCFTVCGSKHVVTFRHNEHTKIGKDQVVEIFSAKNADVSKKVQVVYISEPHYEKEYPYGDFIILKLLEDTFEYYPLELSPIGPSNGYAKIGLDNWGKIIFDSGVIQKRIGMLFEGSTLGESGHSGSGIFAPFGDFAGMVCGNRSSGSDPNDHIFRRDLLPRDLIVSDEICRYLVANDPAYNKDKVQVG